MARRSREAALSTLRRKISQIIRHWRIHKIGITANPVRREREHLADGYRDVRLLLKTTSRAVIRAIEAELIHYYWFEPGNENRTGGGGGRLGEGPYYLYVALA